MSETVQDSTQAVDEKQVSSEQEMANALFTDEKADTTTKPEETPVAPESEGKSDPEKADEKTVEIDGDKSSEDFKLQVAAESGLSEKDAQDVAAFAKENKLTQEAAQKLLDDKASFITNMKARQQDELKEQSKSWVDQIKSDPELGGDKFTSTVAQANHALDVFATPTFRKVLNETGLGNHPELMRTFARVGKKIQNDVMVNAKKSGAAPTKSVEDLLYGDS